MKKKGNSLLGGIIILIIGIGLLWWNEGNNVKNIQSVNEGLKNYTDVSSEKIDAAYDNKLIATNGKLEVTGTITDDEFAVSTNSAVLFRKVEMYQWKEDCDDNNCNYEKVWDDDIIDSSNFEKSGHENPGYMPYESQTITSSNAKLGAFDLPQKLLEQLSTKNRINNLSEENATSHSMKVINGYYTNTNEGVANIGDIRISFYDNNADTVSVLATQTGTTFKTYTAKSGKHLFRLYEGQYNGAEIFQKITDENNFLKWLLRIVGTLMIIGGIGSLFSPLTTLTNKIPILGNLVGTATGLISFVAGLAVSLVVIAIAWFRFRPILSIVLIAIVCILIIFIRMYTKKKNSETTPNTEIQTSNVQTNEENKADKSLEK